MGCYLEVYRAPVRTRAGRSSWATRASWPIAQGNVRVIFCLGSMILRPTTLALLLVIDGVQKNPAPGAE